MSGHSKWANIKHKKAKMDVQRAKIFTKIGRELIVAAKEGGGDPDNNARLKAVIQKARENNMPGDNINRLIAKATGELAGVNYEEFMYEGYGPGGVAVLISIMTDNRNRTAADVRHIFSKNGGNLGESGCVAWMFDQKGLIILESELVKMDEDELMLLALDAGAEDIKFEEDSIEVITLPADFEKVKAAITAIGIEPVMAEVTMVPQTSIELAGKEALQMYKLIDALEDNDDVQDVYHNAELPEEE